MNIITTPMRVSHNCKLQVEKFENFRRHPPCMKHKPCLASGHNLLATTIYASSSVQESAQNHKYS